MEAIKQLGLAALAGLFITAIPMFVGIAYAVRPSERWLGLMRPLTLAAICAAVANTFLGLANAFMGMTRLKPADATTVQYAMLAETSVVPFISFVCLAVGWLSVAIGMRRQP